jgi:nucleotide-binding universal stress UspA family protein
MYKRLLVPLDGSELAEESLTYARELAARLDLEVVLLHVASVAASDSLPMHRAYVDHAAEILRLETAEVLKRLGPGPGGESVRVKGEVVEGYPADEILRYAADHEIDLILMVTHGRSGIRRWLLGSVADKVLQTSWVPIWLVRAGAKGAVYRDGLRFLVPLDGSELAELVLPHVEALAKQRTTEPVEVVLMRVCEPLIVPPVGAPEASLNWAKVAEEHMAGTRQGAQEYLGKVRDGLAETGMKLKLEVAEGNPADEITNYVNKNECDLVVMATHGRSGLSRWAYGSVAGKVLLSASCPIFLVRPPFKDATPSPLITAVRTLPPI